jgi:hypothetical protein
VTLNFQECQKSLKQKSELINHLEEKTGAMGDTLKKLDDKYIIAAGLMAPSDYQASAFFPEANSIQDLTIEQTCRLSLKHDSVLKSRKYFVSILVHYTNK